MVKTKNVGTGLDFKVGQFHSMKPESMWLQIIGEKQCREIIKTHKLDVSEKLIKDPHTDVTLAYDKKGGTLGQIFFFPKDSDDVKIYILKKGVISGRLNNALLVNVYC